MPKARAYGAKRNDPDWIFDVDSYDCKLHYLEKQTTQLVQRSVEWLKHLEVRSGESGRIKPCGNGRFEIGGLVEEAIHFLSNGKPPLIDLNRYSYVVIVNPLTIYYETIALLGPWSKKDKQIWFEDWLPTGAKQIQEGKLFREALNLSPGQVMGLWWKKSRFISEAPKALKMEYAVVVPIRVGTKVVGIFVHDCGKRPDEKYAAWLYRFCTIGLLPLLLPEVQAMADNPMVGVVRKILRECGLAIHVSLQEAAARLLHVANRLSNDERHRQAYGELTSIGAAIASEAKRLPELTNSLKPDSDEVTGTTDINRFLKAVVETEKMLRSAASAGISALPHDTISVDTGDVKKIGASENALRRILRELLLNSLGAISERFEAIMKTQHQDTAGSFAAYTKTYGSPMIKIRLTMHGKRVLLAVVDNGCGMPEFVRTRALDFGFSTRREGTGIGLNIVDANLNALGGRIAYIGTKQDGITEVTIDLPMGDRNG